MKKILFCLLATLISISASLSLAAPAPANSPEQKLQKLSVILDWFPNPDHAPLVVAQQQGYFKEQGLEVELIGPADPADPPKLVAAGKADVAVTYEPEFMQQVDRGLPLISIGVLIDKPLNCLAALKDSKINSLNDLKGKRIGMHQSGISMVMLRTLLQKQGLNDKDVELINVRYNLSQALLSHKVDAVAGMMRNIEVPSMELNNHKVATFLPEESGIPNYNELIYVINAANMTDNRFPRFLAALKKAVIWLDMHPKQGWQQFIKVYPEANNNVNREAWFATLPYFAEEPESVNQAEWQRFSNYMAENKLITKPQNMTKYMVKL